MFSGNGIIYDIKQKINVWRVARQVRKMINNWCLHFTEPMVEAFKASNSSRRHDFVEYVKYHMNFDDKCAICGEYAGDSRRLLLFKEVFAVCSPNCLVTLAGQKKREYIMEYGTDEEKLENNLLCEICGNLNPKDAMFCKSCGVVADPDGKFSQSYSHVASVRILDSGE